MSGSVYNIDFVAVPVERSNGCLNGNSTLTFQKHSVCPCRSPVSYTHLDVYKRQILDLGSTENTVLAREIRTLGVYSEIHPHDITVEELQALDNVKGIILNGGENRVVDGAAVDIRPELYALGYPMISVDHPTSKCEKQFAALPDQAALKNFVFDECKAEANWNMTNFIEAVSYTHLDVYKRQHTAH